MFRELLFQNRKLKAWGVLFATLGSLFWTATASMDLVVCSEPGESGWGFMVGSTCYEQEANAPSGEEKNEDGTCKDFHLLSSDYGDQIHPGTVPMVPPVETLTYAPPPENVTVHPQGPALLPTIENHALKRLATVVMRH